MYIEIGFDWDERKAASNLRKHRVSFEVGMTAFDDPCAWVAPDLVHSTATEERRWLIGESDVGVLVVVFTIRNPGSVYRLISARPASRRERFRYEEAKRVSV